MGNPLNLLLAFIALAFLTCCDAKSPLVVGPCGITCQAWARLKCEEGDPSPTLGMTCAQVCEAAESTLETLPHECIQNSDSCEEARACE